MHSSSKFLIEKIQLVETKRILSLIEPGLSLLASLYWPLFIGPSLKLWLFYFERSK
jgi:hypothetical protein